MATGMFQAPATGEDFSCPSPEQKLGLHKAASHGDISLTSGSASSGLSLKEGSANSSSLTPSSESESESESEFYLKRRVAKFCATKHEAMDGEKMNDNLYQNLLEKVANYERELEFANKVIDNSQEEISRLRSELAGCPTKTGVLKNLRDESEMSCFDVTVLQDDEINVLELQSTIVRLEASLQDSDQSNAMLTEELRKTKERLQTSENEVLELERKLKNKIYEVTRELQHQINSTNEVVNALETKLASERMTVSELQARVGASEDDVTKHNQEIQELNLALSTAYENFSNERSCLLSDISASSKQQKALQSKLEEAELRVKLLEDQVGQSILEKLELRDSLEAQEKQFQADLNQLKIELAQRRKHVELLNKNLDYSKFKYDMLMTEKDELTAKVDLLNAQANCGSNQIQQMEVRVTELEAERSKLLVNLEGGERMATELRLKVAKLEKVAEMQKDVILDRAEEKREAIRQLCYSLEYYRSEYHQLCLAFTGLKRHPVSA